MWSFKYNWSYDPYSCKLTWKELASAKNPFRMSGCKLQTKVPRDL